MTLEDHYDEVKSTMTLQDHYDKIKSTMTLQDHCDEVKSTMTLQDHYDKIKSTMTLQDSNFEILIVIGYLLNVKFYFAKKPDNINLKYDAKSSEVKKDSGRVSYVNQDVA